MRYHVIAALLIISISFAAFPKPAGFVNDFAGILPSSAEFEDGLAAYERNTTIETVVVTLSEVPPDQSLFSYGVELFDEWNIGKKGEDNGLLILIVNNGSVGNRMRIEIGYGLQGYITGAEAGRILDEALPYYEQGDYETVLDIILMGLSDELENYEPGQIANDPLNKFFDFLDSPWGNIAILMLTNLPITIFLAILLISIAFSNRCPYCGGKLNCIGDYCTCSKCGRKISRRKRFVPYIPSGYHGGGGGGFGGFGGGGSGGGGAGR